jgi:hypothetical protein
MLFKNKKVQQMRKIIKTIIGYEGKYRGDKKFALKAFGDKEAYRLFIRNNVEWVLTKCKYEFSEDDLKLFAIMIKDTAKTIVRNNQLTLKEKFDEML